jgi:site-specific recombinase XerD
MALKPYSRRRAEALREKIEDDPPEDLSAADREVLLEFDDELMRHRQKNNRCGWAHHASLLNDLLVIARGTQQLAATLEHGETGEDAVDDVTSWITQDWVDGEPDKSDYTIQSQLSALRNLAATLMDVEFEELPERFAEIEPGSYVVEDPAPLPAEVLRWEDLLEMIKEATSIRDIALLLIQWDIGTRPQKELWTLQKKNIEFRDNCAEITLPNQHGKTDTRKILVTVGWTALQKWVEDLHPAQEDPGESMGPDTYIWTKRNDNKLLEYGSMTARFEDIGKRADIDKEHSAQHFRRSSASILAGKPQINERDLRHRYSWSPKGNAPEHYIERFSDSTQKNVARCRGVDIEDLDSLDEDPDPTPVVCADCKEWTERAHTECVWCGHDIDETQQTINTSPTIKDPDTAGEKSVKELIFDGDLKAADIRSILKVKSHIRSDPEFFGKLEEALPKAVALEDSDDDLIGGTGVAGVTGRLSAAAASVVKGWGVAKHVAMSIHPDYRGYPPSPLRAAGIVAGTAVIMATAVAIIFASGLVGGGAADPVALVTLVVSLLVGSWLVGRDMPTIDEAVDEAVDETGAE